MVALRENFEKQGNWLFKWRSYLPLLLLPLFFIALRNGEFIEQTFGDFVGDCWEGFAMVISFFGLLVRCFTVGSIPRGTSGRNTQFQAAEVLNTTGIYSLTRNPLYLGNFLIMLGITLFIQVWWLAFIVWIVFWLYYERIIFSEEEYLRTKFGTEFLEWAQKTPMVIPCFKNWRKPSLPFSFKTVLRREFSTYFAIATAYFCLAIGEALLVEKRFFVSGTWLIFFFVSMVIYCMFVFLKKKTHILDVSGR